MAITRGGVLSSVGNGKRPSDEAPACLVFALVVAAMAVAVNLPCAVFAAEKNGISPQAISLPSGPGSIEGLGDSFEPQLNTGTATYAVAFAVPPGRVGHAPKIGLAYNGGGPNGLVGVGWTLTGATFIQRQVDKGLPRYDDREDTFVTSGGEELVPLSDGTFRAENEGGFRRYRFDAATNTWLCEHPNGTKATLGAVASARVAARVCSNDAGAACRADSECGAGNCVADPARTYQWYVTREEDPNGNRIEYSYTMLAESPGVVVLDQIFYTRHAQVTLPGEHIVKFSYTGNRPDRFTDFRPGFELVYGSRLSRVDVCTRGGGFSAESSCDGVGVPGAARVRAYVLAYEDEILDADERACRASVCAHGLVGAACSTDAECVVGASRLARVTQLGADNLTPLPPVRFEYTELDLFSGMTWRTIEDFPIDQIGTSQVALADLNADGLPDVLETPETSPGFYRRWINEGPGNDGVGHFSSPEVFPAPNHLLDTTGTQLADLDGNGVIDLVTQPSAGSPDIFEIFHGTGRGDFVIDPPAAFRIDGYDDFLVQGFESSAVRLGDVDFDKKIDLIGMVGADRHLWVRENRGDHLTARTDCVPVGTGPTADFANGRTFLVDMNGDRLLDIVLVTPSAGGVTAHYYPAVGRGGFGRGGRCDVGWEEAVELVGDPVVNVEIPSDLQNFAGFHWQDLTGDGLSDLLYLGPSAITLWVNVGGERLRRFDLGGYAPGVSFDRAGDVLEFADMNGNGTTDVVLVDRQVGAGNESAAYALDVVAPGLASTSGVGVPPHLLRLIDNGIGRRISIFYRSSTTEAVAARAVGQPWAIQAPFPVTVVARRIVSPSLDLSGDGIVDEYVTDYRYRDAYYDGHEMEFRGFGEVAVIERGDVSQPTLVTRHRFHTGAPDGVDNDGDGVSDQRTPRAGAEEETLKGVPLEARRETCRDGSDGTAATDPDCRTPGKVFDHQFERWEVRRLYMPRVCSGDPQQGCCADAECQTRGLGTCGAQDPAHPGRLTETTCVAGKPVRFAVRTGERTTLVEESSGSSTAVDLFVARDRDNFGNENSNNQWGVVNAGMLPPFGCVLPPLGPSPTCGDGPFAFASTAAVLQAANPSTPTDERLISSEHIHDTVRWIVDRPQRVTVTDAQGNRTTETRTYYDGADLVGLPSGQVTRGRPTRQEGWVAGQDYINTVRRAFDIFGNTITIMDGLGVPGSTGHRSHVAYDATARTFPTQETIEVGGGHADLVMSAGYHSGFGVMTSSTDFNGNTTEYGRDRFGRLTSIVKPGDSAGLPTLVYTYALADPVRGRVNRYAPDGDLTVVLGAATVSAITTSARLDAGMTNTFDTLQYVDGLGRQVAMVEDGESGFVAKSSVLFNARAIVRETIQPYALESPVWGLPVAATPRTRFRNDATGREVLRINPPDSLDPATAVESVVRTIHKPLVRTVYDELDNEMTYVTDGLTASGGTSRRLVEVQEVNGRGLDPGRYFTRYSYNPADSLLRVSDAHGNVATISYDGLQRQTMHNHPDSGIVSYLYDEASNVRETVDARQQQVRYSYDGANRLLGEDYLDGDSNMQEVSYHYDVPAGPIASGNGTLQIAMQTKGFLAWVQDGSGEEHTSYDSRGRPVWVVKRIADPASQVVRSYITRMTYDSMDRVRELAYPDNDHVRYEYNNRRLLERIIGGPAGSIIASIDYEPSGQLTRCVYGNGVVTTYAYDPRLRLVELRTVAGSGTQLVAYDYAYDGASNIRRINDRRAAALVPEGDARRNSQLFEYDDLYRLTSVQYSFAVPGGGIRDDGRIEYAYDRIGNALTQISTVDLTENGIPTVNLGSMVYGGAGGSAGRQGRAPGDPPGPHALTGLNGPSSSRVRYYDNNGNLVAMDDAVLGWDYRNRLVRLEDQAKRIEYVYDYRDRRVSRAVRQIGGGLKESSVFVNRYFEVRGDGGATKYVYNGATRIARVVGTLDASALRVQRFHIEAGWNLLSLAVEAEDAPSQLGIDAILAPGTAFLWDGESRTYKPLGDADELPAGSVFWLYSAEARSAEVVGGYVDPQGDMEIPAGGSLVAVPSLSSLPLAGVLPPGIAAEWVFDAVAQRWRGRFPGEGAFLSDAPESISSGGALYVFADSPVQLEVPRAEDGIVYYHQDHLGSTDVLSNGSGASIASRSYYPFGLRRMSEDVSGGGAREPYGFVGKEVEPIKALEYFEARYRDGVTGRFVSVDPECSTREAILNARPQQANCYAYSRNNPINGKDVDGENPIFIGAAIGALAGGTAGVIQHWGKLDKEAWRDIAIKAGAGAVSGAIGGAGAIAGVAPALAVAAAAVGGAWGTFVEKVASKQRPTAQQLLTSAFVGGFFGGLGTGGLGFKESLGREVKGLGLSGTTKFMNENGKYIGQYGDEMSAKGLEKLFEASLGDKPLNPGLNQQSSGNEGGPTLGNEGGPGWQDFNRYNFDRETGEAFWDNPEKPEIGTMSEGEMNQQLEGAGLP